MVVARMVVAAIGGHDEKSPRCLEGAGGGGIGWVGEQLEAVLAVDVSQLMKCPFFDDSLDLSVRARNKRPPPQCCRLDHSRRSHRTNNAIMALKGHFGMLMPIPRTSFSCGHKPPPSSIPTAPEALGFPHMANARVRRIYPLSARPEWARSLHASQPQR